MGCDVRVCGLVAGLRCASLHRSNACVRAGGVVPSWRVLLRAATLAPWRLVVGSCVSFVYDTGVSAREGWNCRFYSETADFTVKLQKPPKNVIGFASARLVVFWWFLIGFKLA